MLIGASPAQREAAGGQSRRSPSAGIGEGDRFTGRLGVGDLPARGFSDIPARVDDQDPVCQVDLVPVESIQDGLLRGNGRFVFLAGADDDDPAKGEVAIRRPDLGREPCRAADADDFRETGHGRDLSDAATAGSKSPARPPGYSGGSCAPFIDGRMPDALEVAALALNVTIPEHLQWTDQRRGEEFRLTPITVRLLPDGHLAAKRMAARSPADAAATPRPCARHAEVAASIKAAASQAATLWGGHQGL